MDRKRVPPPLPALPSSCFPSLIEALSQIDHRERPICPLSYLTKYPHALVDKQGGKKKSDCFSCGEDSGTDYYCTTCNVEFHRGCHKFPKKVRHPYHPQHPLTFTFRDNETGKFCDANMAEYSWSTVLSVSSTSDLQKFGSVQGSRSPSDPILEKCTWCGEDIENKLFYRCSICSFFLDISCYKNIPLQTIAYPKSHHHSLLFYPRPLLTPCDACGLVNVSEPSYACFQCNYMVHQSCIDLPRVIKITRHQHRLSYTPYIEPATSPCRICYKKVDIKYGQYSCKHEDCSYLAHSKCATHENVWDGKELEWEPEKSSDESEDIIPFKTVGVNLIKHFSHEHLLKLEMYDGVRDGDEQCEACVLPIDSRDFYNCVQCDFFLHEVCAGLLRKTSHALHVHPLVLVPCLPGHPVPGYIYRCDPAALWGNYGEIGCSVCSRKFSGFRYQCSELGCKLKGGFQIDVRCTLVPDYFTHGSHEHPLFISTSNNGKNNICCEGCKKICMRSCLQCSVCNFAICYQCATIPSELSYKYDKHPLSLCYGEEVPDGVHYWCELCEKELDPTAYWFYTCNECCITIHLQCLFGSSAYMKPGFSFYYYGTKFAVTRNSKSTRTFCIGCRQRCPSFVYYQIGRAEGETLCSLNCFQAKGKSMFY